MDDTEKDDISEEATSFRYQTIHYRKLVLVMDNSEGEGEGREAKSYCEKARKPGPLLIIQYSLFRAFYEEDAKQQGLARNSLPPYNPRYSNLISLLFNTFLQRIVL